MATENIANYVPKNLQWKPNEGLMKGEGEKQKRIANAVPIVLSRVQVVDHTVNCTKRSVKLQWQNCNGAQLGEAQEFFEGDITNGKFMRAIPLEVEFNVCTQTAREIFKGIIQVQIRKMKIEMKDIYPFGWTGKRFYWLEDEPDILPEVEYEVAVRIAVILEQENEVITALILGLVHGPLKKVLQSMGIEHDFSTFIKGATSIGKTAAAKKICRCLQNRETVVALISKRSELKRFIQDARDITLVIDDFNTSASDRVISSTLQTISEIIQAASDAGTQILDEDSEEKAGNCAHLVITSEKIINNVSTMNRTFLVNMEKALPDRLWHEISDMAEHRYFFVFVCAFIRYVSCNYDEIVACGKADYAGYLQLERERMPADVPSRNRIAETLAVQDIIKKLLVDYVRSVGVDEKLYTSMEQSMCHCIRVCGDELEREIRNIQNRKERKQLLPELASIFISTPLGYEFAENEEHYKKAMEKQKKVIGFWLNPGFVSFNPAYMCRLIEKELKWKLKQYPERKKRIELEDALAAVSVSRLGKELSFYRLTHVEPSEQKQSCRWHTEDKYFHVHYEELLELVHGSDFCESPEYKLIRDYEHGYL